VRACLRVLVRFGIELGVVLALFSRVASGDTIVVTPSDSYDKIESAKAGDEVVIAPGIYRFRVSLTQWAPPSNPIVIRAQDPKNPPVWDLEGLWVEDAPGSLTGDDRGRGCWQIRGATNIHISGLVFRNCRSQPDPPFLQNSSGLRYFGSAGITLKDVVFLDNDNGLVGGNLSTCQTCVESEITVEFCEFGFNGSGATSLTHNIYIFGGTFTLRYSYVHNAYQGQNFHIRARQSTIEYNWFSYPKTFAGDLMGDEDCRDSGGCPQTMLLRGNLIHQDAASNPTQIVAVAEDEGGPESQFRLTMIDNTIVVTYPQGYPVHLSNSGGLRMNVEMDNNLIWSVSAQQRAYVIEDPAHGSVTGTNNFMPDGGDPGSLSATVFGGNPFAKPNAREFRLAPDSTAINGASIDVNELPDKEYYYDETVTRRYRIRAAVYDIGAFESTTTGNGIGPYDPPPRR